MFLQAEIRRLDCPASGRLSTETVPWARPGAQFTRDFEDVVAGHAKQGAGCGYTGVRGFNTLLATVTTSRSAPMIVAQRLCTGSANAARGAKRLVRDALAVPGGPLAKAATATVRRTLVTVPARIACSARRLRMHLPIAWPWQRRLFTQVCGPPRPATTPTDHQPPRPTEDPENPT